MPLDLTPLDTASRLLVEADLKVATGGGGRFQPTGFPDLGPALFKGAVGRWLKRGLPYVEPIGGALLAGAGTYLVVQEFRRGRIGTGGWLAWPYEHPTAVGVLLRWKELVAGKFTDTESPPPCRIDGKTEVNGVPCDVVYVDYSGRLQKAQIDTEKLVGG